MLRRWFSLMVIVLVFGVSAVGAQDQGSTLQAVGDTPFGAVDITAQVKTPYFYNELPGARNYTSTGDSQLSCVNSHSRSAWHVFVASQTGIITVEARGTNYNMVLAVYKNTGAASNLIRCIDRVEAGVFRWEEVKFPVTAGSRYYVMFAAVGSGAGMDRHSEIQSHYTMNSSPRGAFVVPGSGSYRNVQPNIEMAGDYTAFEHGCSEVVAYGYPVFYSFRPSTTAVYSISTVDSSYDTVIMLLLPSRDNALACNDNANDNTTTSRLEWELEAGKTYYIMIGFRRPSFEILPPNTTLSLRIRKL